MAQSLREAYQLVRPEGAHGIALLQVSFPFEGFQPVDGLRVHDTRDIRYAILVQFYGTAAVAVVKGLNRIQ